jgi:hypothetical protein
MLSDGSVTRPGIWAMALLPMRLIVVGRNENGRSVAQRRG